MATRDESPLASNRGVAVGFDQWEYFSQRQSRQKAAGKWLPGIFALNPTCISSPQQLTHSHITVVTIAVLPSLPPPTKKRENNIDQHWWKFGPFQSF